ncbi:MAG: RHS repeat-associated core domain-containing protein [Anaerolineae bacterium]|nr:RHS repeat-associated core domain-containing protein [Anaerolineae bacterium]
MRTPYSQRPTTYCPFSFYEEAVIELWREPNQCPILESPDPPPPSCWETWQTIQRAIYTLAGRAIATRVTTSPPQPTDGLFYFITDHLSSTRLLAAPNGSPVQGTTAHYLPYGDYRGNAPTATPLTERGYTGHHENREIGLTYMNARFYSPTSGRFLTADTLIPSPANPQSHNRYSYVLGNAMNLVDPSGHRAENLEGACWDILTCGLDPDEWDGGTYGNFSYEQTILLMLLWIENTGSDYYIPLAQGLYYELDLLTRVDYDNYGVRATLYGTAPDTFKGTIIEQFLDPDLLLGIIYGIGAAIKGSGGGTNPENIGLEVKTPTVKFPTSHSVTANLSQRNYKHATKHLAEFQTLAPDMTPDALIQLGANIVRPENLITRPDANQLAFEAVVNIGGQDTRVRVVLNRNQQLRSIHIRYR